MDYKTDEYFQRLYQDIVRCHADKTINRTVLSSMLGDFTEEQSSMPPELIETVDFSKYVRERYVFHLSSYFSAPVYVLTPKNGCRRHPAVLALHGHGYGSREIVGLTADGEIDIGDGGIHQHFAAKLVKQGFKVFAPEVIGFGDRRFEEDKQCDRPNSCYMMAVRLLAAGKTLAGLRVFEARRILDHMVAFSDVKSRRIGVMGFSGGGLIAGYTAALDERIRAAVLSGFPNTYKDSVLEMAHCLDNYIPGMLKKAELPAYLGLIAPRPLFIESGRQDPIFPVEGTKEAVDYLCYIYTQRKAPHQIQSDLFEGSHEVNGRYAYSWLKNKLQKA